MIRHLCIFTVIAAPILAGCELTVVAPPTHPARVEDASVADASTADAGEEDAGAELDAGEVDAGSFFDAGVEDAGTAVIDAGVAVGPNGVWLTRNYVAYSSFYDQTVVDDLAARMRNLYSVGFWFVNVDRTGATGRLLNPAPRMNEFLNNVASWESRAGAKVKVIAWVNGTTIGTDGLNLTDPAIRRAVVEECQKLVSPTVLSSYVSATARPFDGVQIDFEPSGFDEVRFNALLTLMDEIRAGLAAVGRSDAHLSFAAHKLGTSNAYQWSQSFYYAMASRVDAIASMTYNSGSTTGAEYRSWMHDQVTGVLRAVSGAAWTDGAHPAPTNGVKVLFGLPAYPASSFHDVASETIAFGADGIYDGLTELNTSSDPSLQYLQGAAVYLHTKGTANDGYARWDTEWWWFGHHWLKAW